ncbi:MAG: hypothetical protein Q9209_006184 [Squamulea sp. 1 TL-2023]
MASSGVQWQIDLPGLSSLVLNMGAAGLKKFAQAGVDVHTLLCMGEIAETCPSCPEYRREINRCRQQQRKQSVWLYKIVEIGTASNFIADELLKKRAGENILALMSTILPFLPEEDCDMFILRLFEVRKVDADKTPGFGQLQAFRDTLLPLAQKTAFKDRTYQYHILLSRLQPEMLTDLHSSLPNIETLVHIVLLFKRLTQEDPRHILCYQGWAGAAWVIAYARHVLGLPVCVLRTSQDSVPINGEYHNAKVLVYLAETEAKCELLVAGVTKELIVPHSQDRTVEAHWMIDLNNINLYDLYLPIAPELHTGISDLTRALTLDFIFQIVAGFERRQFWHQRPQQLHGYFGHCLPQIERRGMNVLNQMGFCRSSSRASNRENLEDFLKVRNIKSEEGDRYCVDIFPGPRWIPPSLAEEQQTRIPDERYPERCQPHTAYIEFSKEGKRVVCLMLMIADIASWLALSDWDETLHILSAGHIAACISGMSDRSLPNLDPWGGCTYHQGHIRYHPRHTRAFMLGEGIMLITNQLWYIVFGTSLILEDSPIKKGVTASEERGVVMARAAAGHPSLKLDATIFNFYEGHISMLGERRPQIKTSGHKPNSDARVLARNISLKPLNGYPEIRITTKSKLRREFVETSTYVLLDETLIPVSQPDFRDDVFIQAWITKDCSHSYYAQATVEDWTDTGIVFNQGLDLDRVQPQAFSGSSSGLTIFLQAVDQNPSGQWISLHGRPDFATTNRCNLLLQRNMCTNCTIELIRGMYRSALEAGNMGLPGFNIWYIIPARLRGEPMD